MAKKSTHSDMLKRLLKAEHDQYTGAIGRAQLRKIADECRSAIAPKGKKNG